MDIDLNTLQLRVKVLIARTQFTTISSNEIEEKRDAGNDRLFIISEKVEKSINIF